MAKCDVCGRPATTQLTVREGGKTRQIALCDQHYAEAMGGGFDRSSPLESLFHGGLFDEFQNFFGDRGSLFGDRGGGTVRAQPARSAASARARRSTCAAS